MGGKSSSSSSSKTTTVTKTAQIDNRIGVSDNGNVATSGGTIHNEEVSADAIEIALQEGFGFGEAALDLVSNVTTDSYNLVEDITDDAFGFGSESLALVSKAMDAVEDTNSQEIIELANLAQSSVENLNAAKSNFDNLLKAGTAITAVYLLSKVMK